MRLPVPHPGRFTGRVVRRATMGCVLLALASGCETPPARSTPGTTATADRPEARGAREPGTTPSDTGAVLDTLRAVVERHRLTALPSRCLTFESQPAGPGPLVFTVRERHGGDCGGDPDTAPRLFTIAIDTATWAVTTDAGSPGGEMEPIGSH